MKNKILLTESEKERILGFHKNAIKESRLNEQDMHVKTKLDKQLKDVAPPKLNIDYNDTTYFDQYAADTAVKLGVKPPRNLDRFKTYSIDHLISLKVFVKDARLFSNQNGINSYSDDALSNQYEEYDKGEFIGYLQGNNDKVIKVSGKLSTDKVTKSKLEYYIPRFNSYYIMSGEDKYIIETPEQEKTREAKKIEDRELFKAKQEQNKQVELNKEKVANQSKPMVANNTPRIASVQTTLGLTTQSGRLDQETLNKLAEKLKS